MVGNKLILVFTLEVRSININNYLIKVIIFSVGPNLGPQHLIFWGS